MNDLWTRADSMTGLRDCQYGPLISEDIGIALQRRTNLHTGDQQNGGKHAHGVRIDD